MGQFTAPHFYNKSLEAVSAKIFLKACALVLQVYLVIYLSKDVERDRTNEIIREPNESPLLARLELYIHRNSLRSFLPGTLSSLLWCFLLSDSILEFLPETVNWAKQSKKQRAGNSNCAGSWPEKCAIPIWRQDSHVERVSCERAIRLYPNHLFW